MVLSFLVGTFKSYDSMAITVEVRTDWESFMSQEKIQRQSHSDVQIIRYVNVILNFSKRNVNIKFNYYHLFCVQIALNCSRKVKTCQVSIQYFDCEINFDRLLHVHKYAKFRFNN